MVNISVGLGVCREPGFHKLCFNSPYLDCLCGQIREVVELFPDADGIFLDIISQGQCCCKWCRELMDEKNLNVNRRVGSSEMR